MTVTPVCIERPSVKGDPSPVLTKDGVARDRAITVRFTKVPSPDSFVFTREEIPEGAKYEETEEGKIHSYTVEDSEGNRNRYFKNITITDSNGESLTDYFNPPELEADDPSLLTVTVARQIPIDVTGFRVVEVTLSQDISGTDGIKMSSDYFWNYKITESTDDKATVTVTSQKTEEGAFMGSAKPEVMGKDYSIGASIQLGFTENAGWQFIKWESSNPEAVRIEEPDNPSAKAVIWEKTPVGETATVTAMCAPRLSATGSPRSDGTNGTVSRNTAVSVTFSRALPYETEEDRAQLNNISITVGGSPVNTSFSKPVLSDSKTIVTFTPDNSNMIDVPEGQTKTVTVTVPSDFYYKLSDGTKVTTGGNGYSFEYRIDSSTVNKAGIRFDMTQGSGTVTPAAAETPYEYSIGQGVQLKFALNEGYIFNGWTVKAGGKSVPSSKISLSDSKSLTPVLTVYEALQGVVVTANCSEKFAVTDISPKGTETTPSKKDEPIKITFNKTPSSKCDLSKIKVSMNGNSIDSYFTERTISGNTITLKNTKRLEIEKGTKKTITITVPESFCYTDTNDISLEDDYTFTYTANYETSGHTDVTFRVINGEDGQPFAAGEVGTLTPSAAERYNLDETANISFAVNEGYQFYGWTCDDTIVTITGDGSQVVLRADEEGNADVTAIVYRRPVVSSKSPYSQNENDTVAKDKAIIITFAHEIDESCKDKVQVKYSGDSNFTKNEYFRTTSEGSRITLTPVKMLPVTGNQTVTVTIPAKSIFYTSSDIKIYMDETEDYEWAYKIKNETSNQTLIKYDFDSSAALKVNKSNVPASVVKYNMESTTDLEYIPTSDCVFKGWKITVVPSGYSVKVKKENGNPYVLQNSETSGTITISDNEKECFVFQINDANPLKATFSVNSYISEGYVQGEDEYAVKIEAIERLAPSVIQSEITPDYISNGVKFDTEIKIPFNKPINTSTLSLLYSGSGKENIEIIDDGTKEHIEDKFTLRFENANKTLVLEPKYELYYLFQNNVNYIDVKITINGQEVTDTENEKLKQEEFIWNYRINSQKEQEKPSAEVILFKSQNQVDYTELSSNPFDDFTDTEFPQNHIRNTVYFDFNCRDKDSGIKKLVIKETLIRDTAGTSITVTGENTPIFEISEPNYNDYYSNNEPKTAYTLKSNDDGVVQLDFCFYDFAENEKKISFYVIKDTKLLSSDINPSQSDADISFPVEKPLGTGKIKKRISDTDNADKIEKWKTKDGKITYNFTIPFTKEYYSTYTLKKNIVFSWGYSENEITNIVEDGQSSDEDKGIIGSYKIECDASKDCFIKIKATDDVGNETELIRVIPRKIGIIKADDNTTEHGAKQILFTTQGAQELVNLVDRYKAVQYGCCYLYSYQENEGSDIEYYSLCYMTDTSLGNRNYATSTNCFLYLNSGNIGYTEEDSRPDGIYKFYVIPYYIYEEENYYGPLSDPFVYYVGISPSIEDPEEPIFPDSFVMVAAEPELNVGYRSVTVRTNDFNKTDDCIYGVRYNIKNSTTYYYSYDESFLVESGYEYVFNLFAVNNKNEIITSSLTDELDLTYDNVAPYMDELYLTGINFEKYTCFSEGIIWTGAYLPQDKGSGIYKNDDGNRQIEYYIIRERSKSQYTETDLSQYTKKILTYPADMEQLSTVVIPFDDLKESIYTLVLNVKDDNKDTEGNSLSNSRIFSFSMNTEILPTVEFEYVWKKNDTGSWKNWPEVVEKTSQSGREYNCLFLQLKNNEWMYGFQQTNQVYNYDRSTYNADVHYCKICSNADTDKLDNFRSYLNLYVCHDYIVRKKNGANTDLNSKAVIIGVDSDYLIYYDAPCFVHTMAYPTQSINNLEKIAAEGNLSSTAVVWESMGREYGLKEFVTPWGTKDYSSYTTPVDEIESGFSYVTITHFADGTVRMSDVQDKP